MIAYDPTTIKGAPAKICKGTFPQAKHQIEQCYKWAYLHDSQRKGEQEEGPLFDLFYCNALARGQLITA